MREPIDKVAWINSISNFDRAAINSLLECWHDRDLSVRYHAYCQLISADRQGIGLSRGDREVLDRGVPLQLGDVVWSVYQSGLSYSDDWYTIHDFSNESGENAYGKPAKLDTYDLWNRGVAHKFISTHIDRSSAAISMHQTIKEILIRNEYPYSGYYYLSLNVEEISQQDVYNFAKEYNIPDLPLARSSQPVKEFLYVDDRDNVDSRWMEEDRLQDYASDILEKLTVEEHYDLIDKIYRTLFGRLAYICKETVQEPTYFMPRLC